MYYPERLKNRRLELGLKQTELAKELGISKQSYFTWEKGTTQPTKANLAKLEELLQVPHGYFSELEIATLYKQLTDQNQEKALTYVQDLLEEQSKVVSIVQEPRFAYRFTSVCQLVSELISMTTWITTRFILIKIWRMILRRGLMGILWSLLITMALWLLFVRLGLTTMVRFMQSFGTHRLTSKRSIVRKMGCA